jgi:hypothetical protein
VQSLIDDALSYTKLGCVRGKKETPEGVMQGGG